MIKDIYDKLPYDLSGSMSKNRFRYELLWGLWEAFDIYADVKDFAIVFDYVCDIELHIEENKLYFYQLKSTRSAAPYTKTTLTKRGTQKNIKLNSILGKLYILKKDFSNIKVAVVVNTTFKSKREYADVEKICLNEIDDNTKEYMCNKLKEEFPNEDSISLDNIYFIHTNLNLLNPNDTVVGKIARTLKEIKKRDIIKPNVLFENLCCEIEKKACYEYKLSSYDEIIKHKGLTKNDIDNIINVHLDIVTNYVSKALKWIEDNYSHNFGSKLIKKRALSSIVTNLSKDKRLINEKSEILTYLRSKACCLNTSEFDIISKVKIVFSHNFIDDYNDQELEMLILLCLKEMEGNIDESACG